MRMDLLSLVVLNLREEYSEEAANELINSPYVASVVNNSETMQRIAINRYLTAAILKFRAVTNVDMSNLLFMLVFFNLQPIGIRSCLWWSQIYWLQE